VRITKNVFLDSSVFIGQNLDFTSESMSRLAELALADEARVFTTPIVIREVNAKFRERIRDAATAFAKVVTEHPVLKIVPDDPVQALLRPIDVSQAARDFDARYRRFRKDIGTRVIPIEDASAVVVFDSYFAGSAPFKSGKKEALVVRSMAFSGGEEV
jgi:PIN domain-containing protein